MNQKRGLFLFLLLAGGLLFNVGCPGLLNFNAKILPCSLVSKNDAEKILGQPVRLANDTSEAEGDGHVYKCSYATLAKDEADIEEGVLFFTLAKNEKNPGIDWAKSVIAFHKQENAANNLENLPDVGDEAFYYESQGYGITRSIWARKNDAVFRIQMDAGSDKISVDELKNQAKRIAGGL